MIYGIGTGIAEATLIIGIWNRYKVLKAEEGQKSGGLNISFRTIILFTVIAILAVIMNILLWKKQYRIVTCGNLVQVFVILAIAAGIDYRKHLIPNKVLVVGMVNRVFLLVIEGVWYPDEIGRAFIVSVAGLILCMLFMLLLVFLTRNGIGYGDVKLLAWLGFCMGIIDTYYILFYAVLFTAITGIFLLTVKKVDKKKQLPFAPFVFMGNYLLLVMTFLQ